jgi:hypothetical protein
MSVTWLSYPSLAPYSRLRVATFSRRGGVSPKPFDSLNFCSSVGDLPQNTRQNHLLAKNAVQQNWGISRPITFHYSYIVHGTASALVEENTPEWVDRKVDILLTNVPYKGLMMSHADCQAAVLYDPLHHALAVVHCGWRGNVQNVYGKAVNDMKETFGSNPHELVAVVSPSLGPSHAEFVNYAEELPRSFWEYQVKPLYFDLWAIAAMQLQEAGLKRERIEVARICTYEHIGDYYSYRRDKVTGRNATFGLLL